MPATYFYIKGSKVEEDALELGIPNNLIIKNRYGECCIAFANQAQVKDWSNKIRSRVLEIQIEDQEVEFQNKLNINEPLNSHTSVTRKKRRVNYENI